MDIEDRYQKILVDSLVDYAVLLLDVDGIVRTWNPGAQRLKGYRADEIIGKHFSVFYPPDDIRAGKPRREIEVAGSVGRFEDEGWRLRKDGTRFWANVILTAIRDTDGRLLGYGKVTRDLSERRSAELALAERESKLEQSLRTLQRLNDEMSLVSEFNSVLQSCIHLGELAHPIALYGEKLFSGSSGAVFLLHDSRNYLEAAGHWGEKDEPVFAPDACWALRRGRPHVATANDRMWCQHVHAETAPGLTLCAPLTAQSDTLGLLHLRVPPEHPMVLDPVAAEAAKRLALSVGDHLGMAIANLKLRDTLRTQSVRDPLTRLYNRRHLEESMQRELARSSRSGAPLSVLMVDVDHFKLFNDEHGHEAGDVALQLIARGLEAGMRSSDTAARFGGEEFTLVLPGLSAADARTRADIIRLGIERTVISYRNQILPNLTISIGIAVYPGGGKTYRELIDNADRALYAAKRAGRNRVVLGDDLAARPEQRDVALQ